MLLVELGYDARAAGMVGTDLGHQHRGKLMAKRMLMDKIDGPVNRVPHRAEGRLR